MDYLKQCPKCKLEKPMEDFYKDKTKRIGRASYCKLCHIERVRAYQTLKGKQAKQQAYVRKHKYGIDPEEFSRLLKAQEGKCATCDCVKDLVVDHCHETGKVRGLLCDFCNKMLGFSRDNPDTLQRGIEYLEALGKTT